MLVHLQLALGSSILTFRYRSTLLCGKSALNQPSASVSRSILTIAKRRFTLVKGSRARIVLRKCEYSCSCYLFQVILIYLFVIGVCLDSFFSDCIPPY